jgi:hypothetical protein
MAIDVTFVLIVVILITHPILEPTSVLGWDIVFPVVRTIQVPFADISGMVTSPVERFSYGRKGRR